MKSAANGPSWALICIDSLQNEDFAGRVYSPYLSGCAPFGCFLEMARKLEGLFAAVAFPQPYFAYRTFEGRGTGRKRLRLPANAGPHRVMRNKAAVCYQPQAVLERNRGALATFRVQVLLRQNATWQGYVEWRECGLRRPFYSALQLLHLLEGALARPRKGGTGA